MYYFITIIVIFENFSFQMEINENEKFQHNNLKSLALNGTNFCWDQVEKLFELFPCLEELHLCSNGFFFKLKKNFFSISHFTH